MRGTEQKQTAMFSYVTLERRIPADHPARQIRALVDVALAMMDADFAQLYSETGRPSIPPEQLLRAQLLMILYSIRSERQMIEQLTYNLLFRWFVGLEMDDVVWDATVFTKNRERLIEGAVSQRMLEVVLSQAESHGFLSEEHFTVDGTLLRAWASARSFHDKPEVPPRGKGSGHNGEVLLRDRVESKTDAEAQLYRKSKLDKSVPSYLGHALMENRNGLVVAAEATQSTAKAEREAALRMLDRVVAPIRERTPEQAMTLGADTAYQEKEFLKGLREREIAPHVSEYGADTENACRNSLSEAERSDERRRISQKKRKLVERVFGWGKLDRILRQVKVRGLARVDWMYRMAIVSYNLVRMRRLIELEVSVC